jgi:hypothetical protein
MMRNAGLLLLLLLAVALCGGCTWVALSEEGKNVRLISNNEVSTCERVGNTKARVPRKVWIVPRPNGAVQAELETLARNEGGKIGGNTVTPMGAEKDGERKYAVYVCDD